MSFTNDSMNSERQRIDEAKYCVAQNKEQRARWHLHPAPSARVITAALGIWRGTFTWLTAAKSLDWETDPAD